MGLDMYLYKCKRIDGLNAPDGYIKIYEKIPIGMDNPKDVALHNKYYEEDPVYKELVYIKEGFGGFAWRTIFHEIAYWRKANAIHGWFVDVVQHGEDDCSIYEVSKDHLKSLLNACKAVKDGKNTCILKPRSGFFFGSTDIDEYYWEDINLTIEQLTRVINETDFDKEIVFYRSSW